MITWCFTMTRKIPSLSEPRDSESDATSKISGMIILCSGVTVVGTCSRKAAICYYLHMHFEIVRQCMAK